MSAVVTATFLGQVPAVSAADDEPIRTGATAAEVPEPARPDLTSDVDRSDTAAWDAGMRPAEDDHSAGVKPAEPRPRSSTRGEPSAAAPATPRILQREQGVRVAEALPATSADAEVAVATTSPGVRLSDLQISPDLNCSPSVAAYSSHPAQVFGDTACATILFVDGLPYGPATIPAGARLNPFTPVSQATSGAGTPEDPYVITTVVVVGESGVRLTQVDVWAPGSPGWTTTATIENPQGVRVSRLTHARDCYVSGSDVGTGQLAPQGGGTYCQGATAALGLLPASDGASWMESAYRSVWAAASRDADLPGTFVVEQVDNGQAVSWALDGGATQSRSWANALLGGPTAGDAGTAPNPSSSPTGCSSSRPVNCATGDFWHTFSDVSVPARSLPLALSRTYDLVNADQDGRFGHGWRDSFDMRIDVVDDSATVTQENGTTVTFIREGDDWVASAHVVATLEGTAGGGWEFLRTETGLVYVFGPGGRLDSVRTTAGEALQLAYGSDGALTSVSHGGAGTIRFDHAAGRVSAVTDPAGRVTRYSYDAAGDLVRVTGPGGQSWTFAYDGAHHLLSMTSPRGGTTHNEFDAALRVTAQRLPDARRITYRYDGDPASVSGGTTTMVDEHGVTTAFDYVNMLLVSKTVSGAGFSHTTRFTYDLVTHRLVAVDDEGIHEESHFDAAGRLLKSVDPRGGTTYYEYDTGSFRRTAVTTPMGARTTVRYDDLGRAVESTSADGVVTSYEYGDPDHPGDVTSSTTASRTTSYQYDALGNVVHSSVTRGEETVHLSDTRYDPSGVGYCSVSPAQFAAGSRCGGPGTPRPGTSTVALDTAGRPTSVTGPTGGVTRYTYDSAGAPATSTDETGTVTAYQYDLRDRLTATVRASGTASASTVATTFDLAPGSGGCPVDAEAVFCTATTDGRRTTVEGYNADGQLSALVRPGGGVRHFEHDGSLVVSSTLENGATAYYSYSGGLLTAVDYTDAATADVSFVFDADGNRASMYDGTGATYYEHDQAGRLIAVTGPMGTVRAQYDAAGQLSALTYPDGSRVERGHDAAGRLVSTTDWAGRTTRFDLDDDGHVLASVLPNGRTITSAYDAAGALTSRNVPGTPLDLGIGRDAAGRVTSVRSAGLPGATTAAVEYDPLGQLRRYGGAANGSDASGSPTIVNGVPQTVDPTLQVSGRTPADGPAVSFQSSRLGERVEETLVNGTRTSYRYDANSRLTEQWSFTGPTVAALSATSGPATGGSRLRITGNGFTPGTSVFFGARAAATTVISATALDVVVPPGSGTVDVTAQTPLGRSDTTAAARYTYLRPTITALSPNWAVAGGGQRITVRGLNFGGATSVTVGGRVAAFTVRSPEQIDVTTPAGSGASSVVVTTPQGNSGPATPASTLTYRSEPVVQSVTQPAGPTTGGNTVTIRGLNMTGVNRVLFGATAATGVRVVSSTTVTATAPRGSGIVHVTARSALGTSRTSDADLYGYAAGPAVHAVSPTAARAAGGTVVTITGARFTSTSTVTIGGRAAARTFVSSTSLRATVPAGTGVAAVSVAAGTARSPAVPAARVSYVHPTVTGLSTALGPAGGGQTVVVRGTRLTGATRVLFGSASGTSLTVVDGATIRVTAPAGTSAVDVRVVTPEGTSPVSPAGRYTYTAGPVLTAVSSSRLRARGGEELTVGGYNLAGLTEVTVGDVRVPVERSSGTSATVVAPAGSGVQPVGGFSGTARAVAPTALQVVYSTTDTVHAYDGDGRRTYTEDLTGDRTDYVWDPFAVQPALLSAGGVRLVNGPGDLPVLQADEADDPAYYIRDGVGSTRALLGADGSVVSTATYSPFGATMGSTGSRAPVFGFAGGIGDASGLVYLLHRYLDPRTGTFLTVDPGLRMTGQPYAYAAGDPVNAVDREGLWPTLAIGAVIGAAVGTVASSVAYTASSVAAGDFSARGLAGAAAGGLISGGITGACMGAGGVLAGAAGAMACGAMGGAAGSIVDQSISKGSLDWGRVGFDAAGGALLARAGGALASRAGMDVADGALQATSARWGGLKTSNLIRPGAITKKFYGQTLIGGLIGVPWDIAKPGTQGLLRYLWCSLAA